MKQLITTASNIKTDTRFVSDKIQNQLIDIYIQEAQNIYIQPKIGSEIMQMILEYLKNTDESNEENNKESKNENAEFDTETETNKLIHKLLHGGNYLHCNKKVSFAGLIATLNYYTYARLIRYNSYRLTRSGLVSKDSSHSTKVMSEQKKMQELDALTIADFYMEGCVNFIKQHQKQFPARDTNSSMNRLNFRMIKPNY